jgi:hypothetical protein
LGGQYVEAQAKVIEIALVDDQALEDFKLLLKLNYGASFVEDDGLPLPKATRLRLLVLASAFDFQDCIYEFLNSMGDGLSFAEAISCLSDVPDEVQGHAAMATLRLKLVELLAQGIDKLAEEGKTEQMQQAGDALAEAIGPVSELFIAAPDCKDDPFKCAFSDNTKLKKYILALSANSMKVLLSSDALKCKCENEVFTFIKLWLDLSSRINTEEQKENYYKDFLPLLRFEHMSSDFLGAFVSVCRMAAATKTMPYIMQLSHLGKQKQRMNRGESGEVTWTLTDSFSLSSLYMLFEKGNSWYYMLGVVGGFPIALQLLRNADDKPAVDLYLEINNEELSWETGPDPVIVELKYKLSVAVGTRHEVTIESERYVECAKECDPKNSHLLFEGKSWDGVFTEDSPYLVNDWLKVKLSVTMKCGR